MLYKLKFGSIIGVMETTSDEFRKILGDMAVDYIALNFKGQEYKSAITFVEILLEKLKEGQQNSDNLIIKDIFGR